MYFLFIFVNKLFYLSCLCLFCKYEINEKGIPLYYYLYEAVFSELKLDYKIKIAINSGKH